MNRIFDSTSIKGMFGVLATLTLAHIQTIVSIVAGLVTIGYMLWKWNSEYSKSKRHK